MAAKKRKAAKRPAKKKKARATKKKERRARPQTLRISSVSPSFTVNDLERSLHFYTHVLGFVLGDKYEDNGVLLGAELKSGGSTLWIGQDDFKKGRDRQKGVGHRVYCNTSQDLDDLASGIKARGGVLDHEPVTQPWGVRDFGLTDPDGFKITIQRRM